MNYRSGVGLEAGPTGRPQPRQSTGARLRSMRYGAAGEWNDPEPADVSIHRLCALAWGVPRTWRRSTVENQEDGSVRLNWTAADDAQVHFVVYLKSSDLRGAELRAGPDGALCGDGTGSSGERVWREARSTVAGHGAADGGTGGEPGGDHSGSGTGIGGTG